MSVNVKTDYGAVGNGAADDTAAIQNAINFVTANPFGIYNPSVYFPEGNYRAHELLVPTNKQALLYGSEVGQSRLTYNGAGGVGSYILKYNDVTSGSLPWGGVKNLLFDGYNPDLNTVALLGLDLSGTPIDALFKMDNLAFRHLVNAIKIASVVNCYINRTRWDGIGQYCIYITGNTASEARPFGINQFSWDNASPGPAAAQAAVRAASGILTASMGYGFINILNTTGVHTMMREGRFEINQPMDASIGKPCILRLRTTDSQIASASLDNIFGFFYSTQSGIICNVEVGHYVSMHLKNVIMRNTVMSRLETGGSGLFALPYNYDEDQVYNSQVNWSKGISLGDGALEISDRAPTNANYHYRSPGNIVYNALWNSPGNIRGWSAEGVGHSLQTNQALITGAILAPTDTTVTCFASELRWLVIGGAIKIPGAGVGGADLLTTITDIDYDAKVVTFADAVVSGVGPVTITNVPLAWVPFYA